MARFKVGTEGLRAAAHQCRVGAGQVAIAAECHREASRWEFVEHSLLASLAQRHEATAELLQLRMEKTCTALSASARLLAEAARNYDAGNAEAARLLDSGAMS